LVFSAIKQGIGIHWYYHSKLFRSYLKKTLKKKLNGILLKADGRVSEKDNAPD